MCMTCELYHLCSVKGRETLKHIFGMLIEMYRLICTCTYHWTQYPSLCLLLKGEVVIFVLLSHFVLLALQASSPICAWLEHLTTWSVSVNFSPHLLNTNILYNSTEKCTKFLVTLWISNIINYLLYSLLCKSTSKAHINALFCTIKF